MATTEITLLNPRDERWVALATARPEATIFHHPAWIELLQGCYGYRPALVTSLDASGQPVAAVPLMQIDSWMTGRRVVSLPFSDFCPPLASEGAALNDLVAGLQAWRSHNQVPEIQIRWPLAVDGVYAAEAVVRHFTRLEPDSQEVFRRFARTHVQQPIRQAEKDGVCVSLSDRWEDMRLFYGLHLATRRRLGTPVQPLRFFQLLWAHLIAPGYGFVLLAYQDAQLLAGAVFLHWNETLTYKYSASDPAYWKLRPNNLILWNAICWGCEHGYQVFDWGRTDLNNAGLRGFKLGWGSEEEIIHYSVLADRPPKVSSEGKARRLMTPLIQRSPTWVCRAIGELLYKHFG
jgi:CelD/BcsL family acetyltransferase involved in cellulose biosynthesis